ncbi:gamma-aminobutyric acid receptor alpha-like [Ornithodoros turicata]|uniref:gamma-aminobutyric acid receptor alpha-like n=1 Tax=Ornithodoros turicata TaxID=34597 RepID=UPI0031394F54
MDCYFRQSWIDRRLAFRGSMSSMTLSISMLEKIWRPDTSFLNGKHSYLHTITQPNKFVRLAQDGTVLYSSRLTVSASCPMNLQKFPMDTQKCPLRIGSSGYPARDVLFRWNPKRRVVIAKDMKLNQFDLIKTPTDNQSDYSRKEGPFTVLLVNFQLKRHMGYFLIEVYAPCTLLVVLSWVSFWINREATADRIALGVTTILTMTFLALESRNDLPKVAYCTALDFYVALGFGFVFATIVEFAIVHYFTKVGSGEFHYPPVMDSDFKRRSSSSTEEDDSSGEDVQPQQQLKATAGSVASRSVASALKCRTLNSNTVYCTESERATTTRAFDSTSTRRLSRSPVIANEPSDVVLPPPPAAPKHRKKRLKRSRSLDRRRRLSSQIQELWINSVSQVDRVSRVLFPLSFFVMNLVYWLTFFKEEEDS